VSDELVLGVRPLFQLEQPLTVRQDESGRWVAFHGDDRVNYLNTRHMVWEYHQ
jgi:hypothetical protein